MNISHSNDNIYTNSISPQRSASAPIEKTSGSSIQDSPKSFESSPNYVNHRKFFTEPETKSSELSASITENLNVIIKGGEITKFLLTGEISLSHDLSILHGINKHPPLRIRIKNLEGLEKYVPNLSVFKPITEKLGEYE